MKATDKNLTSVKKWLSSAEGRASIEKSVAEVKKRSLKFRKDNQIDPKILKESFTI